MSRFWRISLLGLVSLLGLAFAWGAVRAAGYARSSAPPPPTPAPSPTALFNPPEVSPADAAPGSERQRDPTHPDAPAISFIDSPDATCYLPRPGTNDCYITWRYLNVAAAASQYIISMTVNISNQNRAYFSGFFQNSMYIPGDMLGKGFRVACGTPGSGSLPGYGRQYPYTIRARETGGLSAANYGSVTCPGDYVSLVDAALTGPASGSPNLDYDFTASAFPVTATLPVTYVWQASGYPTITQTAGLSNTQSFNWTLSGTQEVTVTVSNPVSSLVRSLNVIIVPYVPLADAILTGPTSGKPYLAYAFTASVTPLTATLPVTYVWQASGYPTITQTVGLSDTQTFSWATNGSKVVTVTVSNLVSSLVRKLEILIEPYRIYFPLQEK